MTTPQAVDIDLIRQLKIQGKYHEAEAHLRRHHTNLQENKRTLLREIEARDRKIIFTIKKRQNLCVWGRSCENTPPNNQRLCTKHNARHLELQNRWRRKT